MNNNSRTTGYESILKQTSQDAFSLALSSLVYFVMKTNYSLGLLKTEKNKIYGLNGIIRKSEDSLEENGISVSDVETEHIENMAYSGACSGAYFLKRINEYLDPDNDMEDRIVEGLEKLGYDMVRIKTMIFDSMSSLLEIVGKTMADISSLTLYSGGVCVKKTLDNATRLSARLLAYSLFSEALISDKTSETTLKISNQTAKTSSVADKKNKETMTTIKPKKEDKQSQNPEFNTLIRSKRWRNFFAIFCSDFSVDMIHDRMIKKMSFIKTELQSGKLPDKKEILDIAVNAEEIARIKGKTNILHALSSFLRSENPSRVEFGNFPLHGLNVIYADKEEKTMHEMVELINSYKQAEKEFNATMENSPAR